MDRLQSTWVMIPYVPDWRWLLDRDDSPWYPSVKLYRQERRGDWKSVLEKIRADLIGLVVTLSKKNWGIQN